VQSGFSYTCAILLCNFFNVAAANFHHIRPRATQPSSSTNGAQKEFPELEIAQKWTEKDHANHLFFSMNTERIKLEVDEEKPPAVVRAALSYPFITEKSV
jgi:hypothetical protein